MFENPRRGRQARNFTTNVPKIIDLKSSSEQIFSENCRGVPLHCAPCTPEKTFRLVENHCLQFVESIFVNLPQSVKSGVKESLNRFSWYFSLHLFGYFGLVSSRFVFECLFHCRTFDGGAIKTYGWKTASTGVAEIH